MENYTYTSSYPESGDSSPRSREIEFENPPPWEDNQSSNNNNNYKVKFMCSHGGKIHPRPHGNQLSYIGGETKILAVDRSIKFSGLVAKLIALCDADVCFKYQLPGEDLDALISVANDDDLEHMMHEYDRLYRATPKQARLRLFLFPVPILTPAQSFGSPEGKSDRERFVEALNSGPVQSSTPPSVVAPPGNADFLFGLEKGMPPPAVVPKIVDPVVHEPNIEPDRIQKHIQDLQRLQIGEEQQAAIMYRRKSDDNLSGDYYHQKMTEKVTPVTLPGTVQGPVQGTTGYWPEKQISGGGMFPATTITTDQPVYMMPGANMYHAPMARPVTGQIGQGYYTVQNLYGEQPVYSILPPAQTQQAVPQPTMPPKITSYSEGIRMVQSATGGGAGVTDTVYGQMGYDNGTGRPVYYTTQGAVMALPPQQQQVGQYQAMATMTTYGADMRPAVTFNQEGGKVVTGKISQASV